MIEIKRNVQIQGYTTFGVSCVANKFARFDSPGNLNELMAVSDSRSDELLILGGGSNILFKSDYPGLILKNEIKGIEVLEETKDSYHVQLGAGENWHSFVLTAVKNNWAGVENLSLIPGCCGAAPMQNIGAYGVEIKEFLTGVNAYHIPTGEIHYLSEKDCNLSYRESVFKNELKGQYIILSIDLELRKSPEFRVSYGAIQSELERMNISDLSIAAISKAVMNIRRSKLPDPKKIGNAGSFFKNPIVDQDVFDRIKSKHDDMPSYPSGDGKVKLAAGWLIERAGWKGKTFGDVGVHTNQALVLVNYGNGSGIEVFELSQNIINSVEEKFGIILEREVNIV